MQTIADIILACGALGVAFYCFVLSRRLRRFNNLEHGVGGAVAVLSAQVDDLNRALEKAREAAETSGSSLSELTDRADSVARRLELHVAAMHDLAGSEPAAHSSAAPAAASQCEPTVAAAPAVAPVAEPPAAAPPEPAPAPAAVPAAAAAPVPSEAVQPAPTAPAARPVRSFFGSARKPEAVL